MRGGRRRLSLRYRGWHILVGLLYALMLVSAAAAQDTPHAWIEELKQAKQQPPEKQVEVLREFAFSQTAKENPALERYVDDVLAARDRANYPTACERLIVALELLEKANVKQSSDDANEKARKILSEPHFRRIGEEESANWIGRALESIQPPPEPEPDAANWTIEPTRSAQLDGFFYVVIAVLGIGAAVALAHLILHWRWKRAKKDRVKKRRGGLLEEGEELLSTDEWLERAQSLESQGAYREAVRCLYLAVLLRLDEAGIVRFDRYETNWEHLRRIERAPAPGSVRYRWLTQQFDLVWYGEREATPELCRQFRQEYETLMAGLKEGAPA
ncbi:MAG: DUF4129 domain-containing protein [Armatimonadetes bacterium]|nr:MAG: DUF4129 domain-containing protein [Armatimonadota bacterium]